MDYEQGLVEQTAASAPAADPKPAKLPPEELDTDFKRKYPPDAELGKELDDGARVWKVFRDEATAHDSSMLDGWNKTLDILLIFAGLFSAVATAFIIESYKLLQPDIAADYTATALYALVLATNNSAALRMLPPPPSPLTQVTTLSLWINGLWFTSLFLSLSVALFCILVKQWLGEYIARTTASATNILWSRRRAFYFDGLTAWHLAGFISVLPLLLHLSLFLFFGGLGAFLWSLDHGIGAWLAATSIALLLFYAISTALPFWWPDCPTSTPLVNQMQKAVIKVMVFALQQCITVVPIISRLARSLYILVHLRSRATDPEAMVPPPPQHQVQIVATLMERLAQLVSHDTKSTLHEHLHSYHNNLDASVLRWLILDVSDSDSIAVGLQAIGALRPWSPVAALLRSDAILGASMFERMCTSATNSRSTTEHVRIIRSMLCLHGNQLNNEDLNLNVPNSVLRNGVDYPDMGLLGMSIRGFDVWGMRYYTASWRVAASPSLASTALLLLHCPGINRRHVLHILICLQLEEFSQKDWNCAFHALHGTSPHCPRHLDMQCTNACHADLFAHMVTQQDTFGLDREDAALCAVLVEHALSVFGDTDVRISSLPNLLEFMASDACLLVNFSGSALIHLGCTISEPYSWLPSDVNALSSLNRALSNILHLAAQDSDDMLTDSVAKLYLHMLFAGDYGAMHPMLSHQINSANMHLPPAAALAFLLHRREGPAVHASNWEMISSLGYWFLQMELLDAIGSALCALSRRGEDIAFMVDLFFSLPNTFLKALRYSHGVAKRRGMDDIDVVGFLRLVQHCIELRPSWWFDLMAAVAEDGDKELINFAAKLDSIVTQRGPCLECPGSPPGWDLDEQLSVCSFHPLS